MTAFRIESKPTFANTLARFVKAEDKLDAIRHSETQKLGEAFVKIASEEAPGGRGHTIAKEISATPFFKGNAIGFTATPGQIGQWHISGTGRYGPRRRDITPVRANALAFTIDGQQFIRPSVKGIRPNPFFDRAYKRWLPMTQKGLVNIVKRFVLGFESSSE